MAFDRFMIAPLNSGLQNDVRPWLIPDDAFAVLNNAYVFRGRIRKRFGSKYTQTSITPTQGYEQLQSRLRINVGTTDGAGNFPATVMPGAVGAIGQAFSVGDQIFTVWQANGAMLVTGAANGTYNTATRTVVINAAAANTAVYFYPATPVMGLITFETAPINSEPTFAFDTQFAYQFGATGWERLANGGAAAIWTGTDSQFFWGTTWRGAQSYEKLLFVTNFNTPDQIRYIDFATLTWVNPIAGGLFRINAAGDFIQTARIIVPFKDRLILLNTVENVIGVNQSYPNRCRFSQNGSPIDANAWRQDLVNRGGFIDCPTAEAIVGAEFIKDRLIVFFERSTWELAYTGNQVLPFVWQQVNTELGIESTFSVVPFDKVALGIANVGVMACNGANVERVDEKIPEEVFEIHNANDGVFRVHGVRDYTTELVYWTFPNILDDANFPYPNRVLVYNYANGSWAFNDDSITCFGYLQPNYAQTWASMLSQWQETSDVWSSGALQAEFLKVLAGNQEGYVFTLEPGNNEDGESRNAGVLQITNFTNNGGTITIIDHNLSQGDFILIENCQGLTALNDQIFEVISVVDRNTITITANTAQVYTGGGTATRVSRIDIYTKQYNFYAKEGQSATVSKVEFMVDRTTNGQVTVDYFASSDTSVSLLQAGGATGSLLGTGVLETSPFALYGLEATQARLWHPVYLQAEGQTVQLRIYLSNAQMLDVDQAVSDFQLHAMTFYASRSGRLQ